MHLRLRGKAMRGWPQPDLFPYKLFLLMRLTVYLLLVFTLPAVARTDAQQVTLHVKEESLREVFKQIRAQTGYSFMCTSQMLDDALPVQLQVKNLPLPQALEKLFSNQPLQYDIVDKVVVVRYKIAPPEVAYEPPPDRDIDGVVIDEKNNDPLTGAGVTIKGTGRGAVTDKYGRFVLRNVQPDAVLVVSFVGYETREVKPVKGGKLTISLKVTASTMTDMVVTGLFNRPKENFTGAASSFTNDDLKKVSGISLLNAISALDPSFQLVENNLLGSNPNVMANVVLRGGNSLEDISQTAKTNLFNYNNNPNVPLFILDGFEVNLQRINDLDMNRVAKVDILKDAAATSIYGSRAANGVIVIETLRPQSGRLRVTYNTNMVLEMPDLRAYDILNAREKLNLEKAAGFYDKETEGNPTAYQDLQVYYNTRLRAVNSGVNTYWMSQPLRTSFAQRHNLYVEGGNNEMLYGITASYNKVNGVMKGSDRRTTGASTFLSYRVKNFMFRNELSLGFNTANNSPYGTFSQYVRLNPYLTPYDSAGAMKYYLEDINTTTRPFLNPFNPLYNATLALVDQSRYLNLSNNFSLQWQTTQWLRMNAQVAVQRQNDEADVFLPAQHTSFANTPTFQKGSYTRSHGSSSSLDASVAAHLNQHFGKHLFFATVNVNTRQSKFNTETVTAIGFPNPRLDQFVLGAGYAANTKPTGTENITRMAGFIANLSYAYDNRYLLDVSYRLDGSSQFGSNRRAAPFWSAGIGWNLHKEAFFHAPDYISRFKVRYSYGSTGSQNFSAFQGISTSTYYTQQEYRGVVSTYLMAYGNPNLAWQKTVKSNIGADLTLFKRLDVTANYFVEKTAGSIASISTPPSVGFSSYMENTGDLESRGWELATRLNLLNKRNSRDNWSVFVNVFSTRNRITRISNTIDALNKRNASLYATQPLPKYAEGQSTTVIWTVPSLGIDPATGEEIFVKRNGQLTNKYDPLDQTIAGDTRANVEGTMGTNFELRGIGLNVFFRYRIGGQAFNQTLIDRVENIDVANNNVDRRVSEARWMKPGDHTFFKGITTPDGIATGNTFASSRFVQNDNLLSCESLSLYYRFTDRLNKRLHVQNTRVSFYMRELFRFSSIKRERGIDYPFSQSFTLQLQTTF
ncbi:SusC/RagA family TonB-linked outer membrane protein [Filimonas zeae]|uniref:SusC/RagA family TonB-linked outer membrane protein n=2 Tax=Filimonas zeae TaxID=1737353 RepID=A0A917IQZ5_9BACT|nr:SusC/RagA family TonB-linked outer membrane protein [Filimonas zeae]